MKNAFSRIGYTCVFGLAIAGAMLAGSIKAVTVTLPHPVTVGATTLPSGQATFTTVDVGDGTEYFVVRSEHGPAVTIPAQRVGSGDLGKTEIRLEKDGDSWRFEKLSMQGETNGYQFVDQK